jgi:hypothetical protein
MSRAIYSWLSTVVVCPAGWGRVCRRWSTGVGEEQEGGQRTPIVLGCSLRTRDRADVIEAELVGRAMEMFGKLLDA